jgi:hypothetical protein
MRPQLDEMRYEIALDMLAEETERGHMDLHDEITERAMKKYE